MSGTHETFVVESKLTLVTNVQQVLHEASAAFRAFDELLARTKENLATFKGKFKFGADASSISSLETVGRLSKEILESQERISTASRESASSWMRIADYMRVVQQHTPKFPNPPRGPGGGGGDGGGSSSGPRPRGGGEHGFDYLTAGMNAGMAGSVGMSYIEQAFKDDADVKHELNTLRTNRTIDEKKIAEINATADQITKNMPALTKLEAIKTISEGFVAIGDIDEAMRIAPQMATTKLTLEQLGDGKGGHDPAFAAVQAIELLQRQIDPTTHKVDADQLIRQLALLTQTVVGTQGRTSPAAYLADAKNARVAGMIGNDTFQYKDLPAIIIAMGGSRTGTGQAAIYRQFGQGKMIQNAFDTLQDAGLIDQSAVWSHGNVRNIDQHLKNSGQFYDNPFEWVEKTLLPALKSKGVDIDDKKKLSSFLASWSSTAVGLGMFSELALGREQIHKEANKIEQTVANPLSVFDNDPEMRVRQLHASETNLSQTTGQLLMGPALDALKALAASLNDIAAWANANQGLAGFIIKVGAGLTLLGIAAGSIANVVFIGGPLVTGFARLADKLLPFAPGEKAAMGLSGFANGMTTMLGIAFRMAAAAAVIHEVLSIFDKNDSIGSWIDQHVPGAAALDNLASHVGLGRTYKEQAAAAGNPMPTTGPQASDNTPKPVTIVGMTPAAARSLFGGVAGGQARAAAQPPTGPTAGDPRMEPSGGMVFGGT